MRRYIDAEDVEKRIDIVMGSEPKAWDKKALRELKMYVVHALPTADVVEVVRCKDCKYKPNGYTDDDVLRYPNFPHEENNPCPCQVYEDKWYSWIPNDDFYCSYGEREK